MFPAYKNEYAEDINTKCNWYVLVYSFSVCSLLCSSTKKNLGRYGINNWLLSSGWNGAYLSSMLHVDSFVSPSISLKMVMDLVIVEEWASIGFTTFLRYNINFQSFTYSYFGFLHILWILLPSSYFHGYLSRFHVRFMIIIAWLKLSYMLFHLSLIYIFVAVAMIKPRIMVDVW